MSPANEGGRRARGSRPGIIADHEREVLTTSQVALLAARERLGREVMAGVVRQHGGPGPWEAAGLKLWCRILDRIQLASSQPRPGKLDKARARVKKRVNHSFKDLAALARWAHDGDAWARNLFVEIDAETRAILLDTLEGPIPRGPTDAAERKWNHFSRLFDDKPMDDDPWLRRTRRSINDAFEEMPPELRRTAKQQLILEMATERVDDLGRRILPPSPQPGTLDALLAFLPRTR